MRCLLRGEYIYKHQSNIEDNQQIIVLTKQIWNMVIKDLVKQSYIRLDSYQGGSAPNMFRGSSATLTVTLQNIRYMRRSNSTVEYNYMKPTKWLNIIRHALLTHLRMALETVLQLDGEERDR